MKEKEYQIFGVKYKESDLPFNTLVMSFCLNSSSFSILKDYYLIHSTIENLEAPIEELKSLKKGINLIFDRQINKLKGEKIIMGEKERYYSLIDNNGNFELRDYESYKDIYSLYELDDLLNQQDKRIKELEEENGYIIFADGYDENGNEIHRQEFVKYKDKFQEFVEENKQLKQTQKQLAIEKLKQITNYMENSNNNHYPLPYEIKNFIEKQIKDLEGIKNE